MKEMWMIYPSHIEARRAFEQILPSLKTLQKANRNDLIAETDEGRIVFMSALQRVQNFLAHRYDNVYIDNRVDQTVVMDQYGTTFKRLIESRKRHEGTHNGMAKV